MWTIATKDESGSRYKIGVEVDASELEKTNNLLGELTEKAGKLVELLTEAETIIARLARPGITL